MFTEATTQSNLLFKEKVKLTEVKEFGYGWQNFARGKGI